MSTDETLLETIEAWLRAEVEPRAEAIDTDAGALAAALDGLAEAGWLALRAPRERGGVDMGARDYARFQALVARFSGALAFLQTQHQSAASMIVAGRNRDLAERLVPAMSRGACRMGIGYSQLRRPGAPMVVATPDGGGGYRVDGEVPWVTGAGFFDRVLVGAARSTDGASVFGVVPLRAIDGVIALSAPMSLAAAEVAATVSMTLRGWHLPASQVARVEAPGWMAARDEAIVARKSFFALGCARAGLDLVEASAERRDDEAMRRAWSALDAELEACTVSLLARIETAGEGGPAALDARAHAVELAGRCAHAAVAASGGAANLAGHRAQRIYREALLFTVLAQTPALRAATLTRLAKT